MRTAQLRVLHFRRCQLTIHRWASLVLTTALCDQVRGSVDEDSLEAFCAVIWRDIIGGWEETLANDKHLANACLDFVNPTAAQHSLALSINRQSPAYSLDWYTAPSRPLLEVFAECCIAGLWHLADVAVQTFCAPEITETYI